jgi:hypothetical protein
MHKLLLAALLCLPSIAYADGIPKDKAPVGSITASGVYVFSPNNLGADRSLVGWSIVPEMNFVKHLGLQADFTRLSMNGIIVDQSRLLIASGPRYTLAPRSMFTPYLFGEGGEIRMSSGSSITKDWNPVAVGGIGLDFRASKSFAFTLIPGQYIGQYQDNGTWNHSFAARLGFTFNLY